MPRKKNEHGMCVVCDEAPARYEGKCTACYEPIRQAIEEFDSAREGSLSENLSLLTMHDVDALVVEAANNQAAMYDPGTPVPNEAAGVTKLRQYLLSNGTYFRRTIIRKLLMMGLQRKDILVEFLRNPVLRKRWVEPLQDPKRMLERDFEAIENEKESAKTLKTRRAVRTERLEMQYREMMNLANDRAAKPEIRFKALEAAAKFEREISIMQRTINPTPGRGDLPVEADTTGGADPDTEVDEEDEEEDLEYGGYKLPVVE